VTAATAISTGGSGQARSIVPAMSRPPRTASAVPTVRVSAAVRVAHRVWTDMPIPSTTAAARLKDGLSAASVAWTAPARYSNSPKATASAKPAVPSSVNVCAARARLSRARCAMGSNWVSVAARKLASGTKNSAVARSSEVLVRSASASRLMSSWPAAVPMTATTKRHQPSTNSARADTAVRAP